MRRAAKLYLLICYVEMKSCIILAHEGFISTYYRLLETCSRLSADFIVLAPGYVLNMQLAD